MQLDYFASLMGRVSPGLLAHARKTAKMVDRIIPYLLWSGYAPRAVLLTGAFLHDVGKVNWPEELFTKRPLTPADWSIVHAHPIAGANLVREAWPNVPGQVVEIIETHHERPGGKGYPRGIEPSYPALVVAACEVFDAMTHSRGYREALPVEMALAEIEKWGPPEVVAAIKSAVVNSRTFSFSRQDFCIKIERKEGYT